MVSCDADARVSIRSPKAPSPLEKRPRYLLAHRSRLALILLEINQAKVRNQILSKTIPDLACVLVHKTFSTPLAHRRMSSSAPSPNMVLTHL